MHLYSPLKPNTGGKVTPQPGIEQFCVDKLWLSACTRADIVGSAEERLFPVGERPGTLAVAAWQMQPEKSIR